jgi:hypothetical protein
MLTDKEHKLILLSRKLESKKCRDDMIFFGEAMVRAQEALKKDYELDAMRRQYGLSAEGYPGQAGQAAAAQQAEGAV